MDYIKMIEFIILKASYAPCNFHQYKLCLIVEIMSRLLLDHHGEPESTGRPFLSVVGHLSIHEPTQRDYDTSYREQKN